MASFALIACDHGLGHVRRCLLIAKELVARHASVTLFAPQNAVARFNSTGITVVNFSTLTTVDSLRDGSAAVSCWTDRIPPLHGFDLVVSDNLPEVLKVCPAAVLSGSFLWHLVLSGIDPRISDQAESLLASHRPRMIASAVFGMSNLAERTRLMQVGLCAATPRPAVCGNDLLIACGGSIAMESSFRELVESMARDAAPPFPTVWVEPRLLPPRAPEWMRVASFDEAMYRQLAAAVCRPGVGTMTDCLWAGARVFAAWEPGNAEVSFNAARFAELGIGESADSPREALHAAVAFAANPEQRATHAAAAQRVDFDGVRETVDLLMSYVE